MRLSRRRVLGAGGSLLLCGAGAAASPPSRPLVIDVASILTMEEGAAPIEHGRIVVDQGRIAAVGRRDAVAVPRGARRLDARRSYLTPALVDMHVHVPALANAAGHPEASVTSDLLTPYLANGVLAVFNLSSNRVSLAQAAQVQAGEVSGPRIFNAFMIDGSPPVWPDLANVATTPDDGRAAVRRARAEGFSYIKTYSRLDLPTFTAIIDEARRLDMPVVGHIPNAARGQTAAAMIPGFGLVAHSEEFAKQSKTLSDEDIQSFADLCRQSGASLTPTLTSSVWIARESESLTELKASEGLSYVPPAARRDWLENNRYLKSATPERVSRFKAIVDFNSRLVKAFSAAGVPLMAGTDSMIPGVSPGFALHDELELLVAAGLSTHQALAAATSGPAKWLRGEGDFGVVAPGRRADLLLLDADPLADIRNTRKISAVVQGGRVLRRSELDQRLASLATRYAAQMDVQTKDAARQ